MRYVPIVVPEKNNPLGYIVFLTLTCTIVVCLHTSYSRDCSQYFLDRCLFRSCIVIHELPSESKHVCKRVLEMILNSKDSQQMIMTSAQICGSPQGMVPVTVGVLSIVL